MLLDADDIAAALTALDEHLGKSGVVAELFLVGGAVLCMVHRARPATHDLAGWSVPAVEVLDVATAYYPPDQLPERAQLLVEEMFG